jgi:hypothetical protein
MGFIQLKKVVKAIDKLESFQNAYAELNYSERNEMYAILQSRFRNKP